MNKKVLFESLEYLDDDLLERSEMKVSRRFSLDFSKLAYVLGAFVIVIVSVNLILVPMGRKGEMGADYMAPESSISKEEKTNDNEYRKADSYMIVNDQNGLVAYVTNEETAVTSDAQKPTIQETVVHEGVEYHISINCSEQQKQQAQEMAEMIIREYIQGNILQPEITEYHY